MTEITSHEASRGGKAGEMTEGAPSSLALGVHLLVVVAVTAAAAALIAGPGAAASVALGIGIAALNLLFMRRIVCALTAASGLGALWALALPAKLVALVGTAYLLVQSDVAQPVPLAIGFALLPLSSVFLRREGRSPEARERAGAAGPSATFAPRPAGPLSSPTRASRLGSPTRANPPPVT